MSVHEKPVCGVDLNVNSSSPHAVGETGGCGEGLIPGLQPSGENTEYSVMYSEELAMNNSPCKQEGKTQGEFFLSN